MSRLDYWVGLIIDGTITGCIFAIIAMGFVIIYRATGVFNFAQGQLVMVGAYLLYQCSGPWGLPMPVSIVLVLVIMSIVGVATYLLALRPLISQPIFSAIVVTLGVAIIYSSVTDFIWGPNPVTVQTSLDNSYVTILNGFQLKYFDIFLVGFTVLIFGIVMAIFRYTSIGLKMRATSINPLLASQRGINLARIYSFTWALAAITAAVAGVLYALSSNGNVTENISTFGFAAFPAALIGGFDSIGGALVGGIIVGIAESIGTARFGGGADELVAAILLIVVLMARPTGLFGKATVQRV